MPPSKQLLIIGGTRQIGKRLIEYLDAQEINEWQITVFNRGNSALPIVNQPIRQIIGDRDTSDIDQICKQDWDVVLDCIAYKPSAVERLLQAAQGRIKRYILISTISVYDMPQALDGVINEKSPRKLYQEGQLDVPGMRYYGECKVATEDALFDCKHVEPLVLRPYFIVGKYDYNNLDYYWINRIKKYDKILIPGGLHLVQRTYLEDLVRAIVHFLDAPWKQSTYLAVTENPITIQQYLECNAALLNRKVEFITAPTEVLLELGVRPTFDLPYTMTNPPIRFDNSALQSALPFQFAGIAEVQSNIISHDTKRGLVMEGTVGISRGLEERILNK
jgi:nucleoside-diphosphate-sugar epimerase